MPAVISQFIKKMTFNDELETRKAIYLDGGFIPLTQVTWEQLSDPKAIVPRTYDEALLPAETRRRKDQYESGAYL